MMCHDHDDKDDENLKGGQKTKLDLRKKKNKEAMPITITITMEHKKKKYMQRIVIWYKKFVISDLNSKNQLNLRRKWIFSWLKEFLLLYHQWQQPQLIVHLHQMHQLSSVIIQYTNHKSLMVVWLVVIVKYNNENNDDGWYNHLIIILPPQSQQLRTTTSSKVRRNSRCHNTDNLLLLLLLLRIPVTIMTVTTVGWRRSFSNHIYDWWLIWIVYIKPGSGQKIAKTKCNNKRRLGKKFSLS